MPWVGCRFCRRRGWGGGEWTAVARVATCVDMFDFRFCLCAEKERGRVDTCGGAGPSPARGKGCGIESAGMGLTLICVWVVRSFSKLDGKKFVAWGGSLRLSARGGSTSIWVSAAPVGAGFGFSWVGVGFGDLRDFSFVMKRLPSRPVLRRTLF